jgi:fucose permease
VLVGGLEAIGLGWRGALLCAAIVLALLIACFRNEPFPSAVVVPSASPNQGAGLPAAYWAYWVVILLSVAVEFSIIGWGAEFLDTTIGLETNTAATAMAVFFLAMVCGRIVGSRLARRFDARSLLLGAILVVAAGFPLFWLPRSPLASIAGLLIAGLGVGNLFPLTIALALGTAQPQTNVASARVTLGAGLAVLGAPLLLGALGDYAGIANAYGAALVLILATLAMVVCANSLMRRGVVSESRQA